jgi:hypothetical protein
MERRNNMKRLFEHMVFEEGGCGQATNIVGRKSLFKNEQDFIDFIFNNYEYLFENINKEDISIDKIYITYIRFYPNMPNYQSWEIDCGYTFCKKNKGAIEVYCYNIK